MGELDRHQRRVSRGTLLHTDREDDCVTKSQSIETLNMRDWYAAFAMQALLANMFDHFGPGGDGLADAAFKIADEMLDKR